MEKQTSGLAVDYAEIYYKTKIFVAEILHIQPFFPRRANIC